MNPSSPTAAPPRPSTMPSFRSFVSVELPFTLAPTVTSTAATSTINPNTTSTTSSCAVAAAPSLLSADEKREVEAFLPPSFVVECVQHAVPQRTIFRSEDGFGKRSGGDGNRDDAAAYHDEFSDDDDRSESDRSASSGGSTQGSEGNADEATGASVSQSGAATKKSGARQPEVRLLTRHRRDYCTDPIFSDWRSTNWDAETDATAAGKENEKNYDNECYFDRDPLGRYRHGNDGSDSSAAVAVDTHTQSLKRRRKEVFPSIEPQVLVNGYYRNDLLVQVRRTRRIRRYRDPVSNAVLLEEVADVDESNDNNVSSTSTNIKDTLVAEVLGVVSRELELARPADFTFSLFTPEQLHASPSLCGADFFPPAHFLYAKAPFEIRYEPGKEANTSVERNRTDTASFLAEVGAAENNGEQQNSTTTAPHSGDVHDASAQYNLGVLPTITVAPEETATMPVRLPAHDDFLRSLPSSLDGSRDDDPAEVRMMVRLLAERPVWIVQELTEAMLESGLCPRTFRNKEVMNCFTYVIRNGPFNRLRVRLGYDPYANSRSAPYERVAVRLHRRSDIGVRLRDASRSPFIDNVVRLLLERDKARRAAYKAASGDEHRLTLLELQCRAIRDGRLVLPYQLVDAADDELIADILRNVAVVDVPMECSQRGQRHGWLSEAAYTRAMTHFTDSLAQLLAQEVEPLLRKFKGEDEATHRSKRQQQQQPRMRDGGNDSGSVAPLLVGHAASADDDEEDGDTASSISAMSAATAGDPPSDLENVV